METVNKPKGRPVSAEYGFLNGTSHLHKNK